MVYIFYLFKHFCRIKKLLEILIYEQDIPLITVIKNFYERSKYHSEQGMSKVETVVFN